MIPTPRLVVKRIEACKQDRLNGAEDRQKLALTPMLFRKQMNPKHYAIIPRVSSERRRYIPLGFLDSDAIPTDSATIISDANLYDFGILTSNVHAYLKRVLSKPRARLLPSEPPIFLPSLPKFFPSSFPIWRPTEEPTLFAIFLPSELTADFAGNFFLPPEEAELFAGRLAVDVSPAALFSSEAFDFLRNSYADSGSTACAYFE